MDSCLQNNVDLLRVHLLILDGNSSDGTWEVLQSKYAGDRRIRLLRQTGEPGFMAACLQAVPLLETPWATFMYDDDVLSPHWHLLPNLMEQEGMEFGMGLGKQAPVDQILNFPQPHGWLRLKPAELLRGYGESEKWWRPDWLPVSPICCLTHSSKLRQWSTEVQHFAEANTFRREYLIRRAAGPDLMIYLLSILQSQDPVAVLRCPIAQFSLHSETISGTSGDEELALGYWLAKVWLAHQLTRLAHPEAAAWAAWVIHRGLFLLKERFRQAKWAHSFSILKELVLVYESLQGANKRAARRAWGRRLTPKKYRPPSTVIAETLTL